MQPSTLRNLVLLSAFALWSMGSTCVVITETPEDIPYSEESATEQDQEEEERQVYEEMER